MIGKIAIFCKNFVDWFKSDRCFVKYFIDAFKLTNDNLLLLTLLILFLFIESIYTWHSANSLLTPIVLLLLTSAFAAGFFYSIKKSIELQYNVINEENSDTGLSKYVNFGMFYSGVGKHWLSFLGMFMLFFIIGGIWILLTCVLARFLICDISKLGIGYRDYLYMIADPNMVKDVSTYVNNPQFQINLRDWVRLFSISTQLLTFLLMFWIPEVMYTKGSVFKTMFTSIKKVITDLPNALCIFLTIFLMQYIVGSLLFTCPMLPIFRFILNIISIYLLAYGFYAIFLYYKNKWEYTE